MDYLDPSLPVLIRTARTVLDWSQHELAERSGVAFNTIGRIERCETAGRARTVQKLVNALESAGLIFQITGVSFGLLVQDPLATKLRKQVRDQQMTEGGFGTSKEAEAPQLRTRVRKRKVGLSEKGAPQSAGKPKRKRRINIV